MNQTPRFGPRDRANTSLIKFIEALPDFVTPGCLNLVIAGFETLQQSGHKLAALRLRETKGVSE
jgi:hypothetical protein